METNGANAKEEDEAPKRILLQGMDDIEDQDDIDMVDSNNTAHANDDITANATNANATSYNPAATSSLIPLILTPSPFQHHNDSGTADRYRSALQRITATPTTDVEAWEAIMNESMSLYRTQLLPQLEAQRQASKILLDQNPNGRFQIKREDELERKLDWVESCYGHLLKYFPYSSNYFISAVEFLMARSALPYESLTGGDDNYIYGSMANWVNGQTPLQVAAGTKIDKIFEMALGVKTDGSPADINDELNEDGGSANIINEEQSNDEDKKVSAKQSLGGMCSSSVELWLLYIRKRTRDAKREALLKHAMLVPTMDPANPTKPMTKIQLNKEGEDLIREWITESYEAALENGSAFVFNNHLIWRQYLGYVKSWNIMQTQPAGSLGQEPISGIDHSLASKQKASLRSIYQRIITLPMLGLDGLWVEYENFEKAQSEQLAVALIAENLPRYQHARSVYLERNRVFSIHELGFGRLATPPADYEFINIDGDGSAKKDVDQDEYRKKMKDEINLLAKWKRRCAYERTNPERLSATELTSRIRQCYKDSVCCFMRHIEVWHEWSTWEFVNAGTGGGNSSGAGSSAKKRNLNLAIGVLELAEMHVPDSTLLSYAHAELIEGQPTVGKRSGPSGPGEESIRVMRNFCARAGNTLGYVLLQRLVRKYQGAKEARAIFSEARRKLRIRQEDAIGNSDTNGVAKADVQGGDAGTQVTPSMQAAGIDGVAAENGAGSKIVMNRSTFMDSTNGGGDVIFPGENISQPVASQMGYLTWHLYASHAAIEHRLNNAPQVAARVYELGLKKHRSFLSTPQYVLQYSSLLLELNDEENLRALLTRAISACEEENEYEGEDPLNTNDSSKAAARRELQRPLWDMILNFESMLSARSGDNTAVRAIEVRRRKALYGPNFEDVSSGSTSGKESGEIGIGVQKISLSETLIRSEGYDSSSRIVNGLGRLVDTLEVSGIIGQDSIATAISAFASIKSRSIWKDDGSGGLSDASYRRRKIYQTEMSSIENVSFAGPAMGVSMGNTSSSTGRLLSAKERLAQSAALGQNTSVMASVQASPEWLRGMLMLLPATIRNYRGKAPPHMIEMALTSLKSHPLPAERPAGKAGGSENFAGGASKRSRGANNGGYSSDEDDLNAGGNGYGSQFRARQRARVMGAQS